MNWHTLLCTNFLKPSVVSLDPVQTVCYLLFAHAYMALGIFRLKHNMNIKVCSY